MLRRLRQATNVSPLASSRTQRLHSCVLLIYNCNGYLLLVSAFRRTMHYTLASHSPTLGAALHSAAHLLIPAIPSYSDMSTVSTSVHPMFHGDPDPVVRKLLPLKRPFCSCRAKHSSSGLSPSKQTLLCTHGDVDGF